METRHARVVLETTRHRIAGTLHLPRDGYRSRITDFLNASDRDFIALTEVELTLLDGSGGLERHDFLAVARNQVVLVREEGPDPGT
jgi:uncharacterized protein DUF6812